MHVLELVGSKKETWVLWNYSSEKGVKFIFDALYNQWCLHASFGACVHRHELTLSVTRRDEHGYSVT